MKAESGMTPPPIALPRHMMSGTTPQWSTPNSLPVRPSPVWTSSAMSRVPYSSQALRIRGQKSSGGTMAPASPWIGSMITAGDALAGLVRLVELVFDRFGIAELDEVDSRKQRQEGLAVLPAAEQRERAAALAVETAQRADEVGLSGEHPRQLDRAFHGVGAVVDEEGILQISRRDFAEELRERAAERVQELLARERHAAELIHDRLDDLGMPDPGAVDAVAAEAIDVGAAGEILERRAFAGPLERRILAHLDHRLAVLEVAAGCNRS